MSKILINERRSPSYIKPFTYLALQLIVMTEMFYVTTTLTPYKELIYNVSMIIVLIMIHRTFVILRRTLPQKKSAKKDLHRLNQHLVLVN